MSIILIGGGSRSGKSRFALERARAFGSHLVLLATAEAFDDEMRERIHHHQQDRDPEWTTIEEPLNVPEAIAQHAPAFDALVVDCLTLWLTNLLLADHPSQHSAARLLIKAASSTSTPIILVTNEVGCGLVPETPLGRRFRDEAGRLNQSVAQAAAEVHWTVFGIPLRMK